MVQAYAPALFSQGNNITRKLDGRLTAIWSAVLAVVTLFLWLSLQLSQQTEIILLFGLFVFGGVFAINSALHSYLIIALAKEDGVSMDVGFYYTANALGRLLGTILSGFLYQSFNSSQDGLLACLFVSFLLAIMAALFIKRV